MKSEIKLAKIILYLPDLSCHEERKREKNNNTLITETKRDTSINNKTGLTGPSFTTSELIKDSRELNSDDTFAGSELKATGFGRGLQSSFCFVVGAPVCQ